ncbi:hypothetical protein L2E82_31148 [Cichorium intybus]|uniref:Uncharacterized protein n=1 Tax=Cichorium intybus TaxID=13427 RepID=A0ACB9D236_CICIN|nr:hypothetical protein L2E82_31148 [Cichorium intybus]
MIVRAHLRMKYDHVVKHQNQTEWNMHKRFDLRNEHLNMLDILGEPKDTDTLVHHALRNKLQVEVAAINEYLSFELSKMTPTYSPPRTEGLIYSPIKPTGDPATVRAKEEYFDDLAAKFQDDLDKELKTGVASNVEWPS